MSLDEKVSTLIGRIYEGAHAPAAWEKALDGLIEHTGSRFVLVSAVDLSAQGYSEARFHGADDARFLDGIRDYKAELYRTDPTLQFGMRHPRAGYVTLRGSIGSDADYATHPYVRWIRDVLGAGDTTVRYTPPEDDLLLGVSIHPSASRAVHSARDTRLFGMLFAHIERAMRLVARPPDFASALEARLLLDARGRVRAVSDAALALFGQQDGLAISDGRLVATRRRDADRIDALVRSALEALTHGGAGGSITIQRPSGRRDWLLTAGPLPHPPSPFEAFRPAVQVRIVDPAAGPPPQASQRWRELFGLTPAEARLSESLMTEEAGLRETANKLGIAYATARVHLANIFHKVGVDSQAQLVRVLTRIGVWMVACVTGLSTLSDFAAEIAV